MHIFDRWGKLVYNQEGLQPKWDGLIYSSRKEAKSDVYVYLINYTTSADTQHEVKGIVTLSR